MTETMNRSGFSMFATLFSIQRVYMALMERTINRSVEAMTQQTQYSLDAMTQQSRASLEALTFRAQNSLDVMSKQMEQSLDVMVNFLRESSSHVEMVRDTINKVEAEVTEQVTQMPVVFNTAQDGKSQQGQSRSSQERHERNGQQEQHAPI
jgi:hypothetical protein